MTLTYTSLQSFGNYNDLFAHFPNRNDKALDVIRSGSSTNSYLGGSLMAVRPEVRGIKSGWAIYRWLFQVSVYIRDGKGEIPAMQVAERLREYFAFNTIFEGVDQQYKIINTGDVSSLVPSGTWPFIPVTFRLISAR